MNSQTINVWDTNTWQPYLTLPGIPGREVAFVGETLIASLQPVSDTNEVKVNLYDVHSGTLDATVTLTNISGSSILHLTKMRFSPDGNWLVISTQDGANVYRIERNTIVFEYAITTQRYHPNISWSLDSQLIIINNGVYQVGSANPIHIMDSWQKWYWAPEGKHLALPTGGMIYIYGITQ